MVAYDCSGAEVRDGSRIIWRERGAEHTGIVEADAKYNGGLKVGGRSYRNIFDDCEWVRVVS